MRRAWEARHGQPARGNPYFEWVSLVDHALDLALANGHGEERADAQALAESEQAEAIAEAGGNPFPILPSLEKWRPK